MFASLDSLLVVLYVLGNPGGVRQPASLAGRRGNPCQVADDAADRRRELAQPLVVAGLPADVGNRCEIRWRAKCRNRYSEWRLLKDDPHDRERDELGSVILGLFLHCVMWQEIVHQRKLLRDRKLRLRRARRRGARSPDNRARLPSRSRDVPPSTAPGDDVTFAVGPRAWPDAVEEDVGERVRKLGGAHASVRYHW